MQRTLTVEIPDGEIEQIVLPRPTWARVDAICGRRGIVQISKATFAKAVNEGAVRFLKDGESRQASCVYSVADLEAWVAARARTKTEVA